MMDGTESVIIPWHVEGMLSVNMLICMYMYTYSCSIYLYIILFIVFLFLEEKLDFLMIEKWPIIQAFALEEYGGCVDIL